MTLPAPLATGDESPRRQDFIELKTASKLVDQLESILRDVGNCGVTDPTTSVELEQFLGGAYAAANRWLLEKRLDTNPATLRGDAGN